MVFVVSTVDVDRDQLGNCFVLAALGIYYTDFLSFINFIFVSTDLLKCNKI